MAYSCPDKKGLDTQVHVWEKQKIAPQRKECHYWRGPERLEPYMLAPLCPCLCGLRQPLPPCVPRSSLLYQDWLLHWYLEPFHLHIPRAHWSSQRNRQGAQ